VGSSTTHNPIGLHGLLRGYLYFYNFFFNLNTDRWRHIWCSPHRVPDRLFSSTRLRYVDFMPSDDWCQVNHQLNTDLPTVVGNDLSYPDSGGIYMPRVCYVCSLSDDDFKASNSKICEASELTNCSTLTFLPEIVTKRWRLNTPEVSPVSQLLYRAFQKELYNRIPNVTAWRVLWKRSHLKAYKLSVVQQL
jgi:hypothetical protein